MSKGNPTGYVYKSAYVTVLHIITVLKRGTQGVVGSLALGRLNTCYDAQ